MNLGAALCSLSQSRLGFRSEKCRQINSWMVLGILGFLLLLGMVVLVLILRRRPGGDLGQTVLANLQASLTDLGTRVGQLSGEVQAARPDPGDRPLGGRPDAGAGPGGRPADRRGAHPADPSDSAGPHVSHGACPSDGPNAGTPGATSRAGAGIAHRKSRGRPAGPADRDRPDPGVGRPDPGRR